MIAPDPAAPDSERGIEPRKRTRYHPFRARPWSYVVLLLLSVGLVAHVGDLVRGHVSGEQITGGVTTLLALGVVGAVTLLERRLVLERPPVDPVERARAVCVILQWAGSYFLGFGVLLLTVSVFAWWPDRDTLGVSALRKVVWGSSAYAAVGVALLCLYPWARRRLRAAQGLCVKCGYNLTGNVSGRCSECGSTFTQRPVAE